MADKYPPPQYPPQAYDNNSGYMSPPPQGQMQPYGDPNQQQYNQGGYYPPQGPQYGPPQGYYPQQQPMYVEDRRGGGSSAPGICAGLCALAKTMK
ncbi:hypothetical protein B0A52_02643 [Exophiala mesophila]|uniref:Cysteine-rich transmembrane CYSTM domain-containing protein n=1 Tax=Exophiala mesophila TaxID=212818 RepID=A0A438ND80_EXOME|nr:hypothetical protein B0A52_02643 [Exophiala mesophila]